MPLNLNRLNPRQRESVLHPEGPLLILAGAGSGKTSTMAYRIAHLVTARGVSGTSILGLSFTNKAARELRERVTKLISRAAGPGASKGLTVTTFHSLCVRVLRAHGDKLGFSPDFTILDQNDQLDVLKQVLRQIKIDDRKFDPQRILFEIGQTKNRSLTPEQAQEFFLESKRMPSDYGIVAASAYPKYQEKLRILNAVDFDDLIYYTVDLLKNHATVREHYNKRFAHILVDEYQDTNPAQFEILRQLTEHRQNLCVVGDDDQSIYAWRGADPAHILAFGHHYPKARTVILEQNYRSTSRILEAANSVIAKNSKRYPKKLWSDRGEGELVQEVVVEDDHGEADFVGEEILRRKTEFERPWSDFAILYRSNAQSRVFEESLRRRGIPYKIVGGYSFLDRKEVKDVLAYLRLVVNPNDDPALRRVINFPARGIGKTSMEALSEHALKNEKAIFEVLDHPLELSPKAAAAVAQFRARVLHLGEGLRQLPAEPVDVAQWAQTLIDQLQLRTAVEEDSDDPVQAAKKWENVEELVHSLGQFKYQSEHAEGAPPPVANGAEFLREFLNRMMLQAQEDKEEDEDKKKDEKNQVTLLTLHGAKGLEFSIVFMVGMEDGILPHRRTIEEATDLSEERRLCYVGITRAKDFLFLTRTKNRVRYGKPVPRVPSRFLEEIPIELLVRQNHSNGPDLSMPEEQLKHEVRVKNYLDEIRAKLAANKKS
jgi:superfamily I DNA/RNA helicase